MPSVKRCTAIAGSVVTFTDVALVGTAGPGVPVGGTAGQVLAKIDSSNYNTQWTNSSVADGSITLAKLANLAPDQVIGRVTATTGVPEVFTITAAARSVLDDTTTAAMLTTLGAQPADADLTALGSLVATTGNMILSAGSAWTSAPPSTVRTALGLTVGTNVQAWDADLDTLAGLTATANNVIQSLAGVWASRTPTQLTATLDLFTVSLKGLVPAPVTASSTRYLRDDGTWAVPPDTGITQGTADSLYSPIRQVVAVPTAVSTYTIGLTDENRLQEFTLNAAIAVKVPTNATTPCPIGFRFDFFQSDAVGKITVSAVTPGTTTVIATPSAILRAQGSAAALVKVGTDRWLLVGDLT